MNELARGDSYRYDVWIALTPTKESSKLILFWRNRLTLSNKRMRLRSCKKIVIWVGTFYPVEKNTAINHVMGVIETTATILLL